MRAPSVLYQRTGGVIGSLFHLLRGAAIDAILTHVEAAATCGPKMTANRERLEPSVMRQLK